MSYDQIAADCLAEKWQCDLGNGEFDHDWEAVRDFEGDPGVIGGTKDICYLRCRACGAEDYDVDRRVEPLTAALQEHEDGTDQPADGSRLERRVRRHLA